MSIYFVIKNNTIESVHDTPSKALTRAQELHNKGHGVTIAKELPTGFEVE